MTTLRHKHHRTHNTCFITLTPTLKSRAIHKNVFMHKIASRGPPRQPSTRESRRQRTMCRPCARKAFLNRLRMFTCWRSCGPPLRFRSRNSRNNARWNALAVYALFSLPSEHYALCATGVVQMKHRTAVHVGYAHLTLCPAFHASFLCTNSGHSK